MEDEKRVTGLLEMASQRMKRFRELEEIEWKINFSIWALLAGLAYPLVTGHVTVPLWLKSPCAVLLVPIPMVFLHGIALFMLHRQEETEATSRNHYRDQAEEILGNVIPKIKPEYLCGLRLRHWSWIGWELLVTVMLAVGVLFLLRSTPPVVPK